MSLSLLLGNSKLHQLQPDQNMLQDNMLHAASMLLQLCLGNKRVVQHLMSVVGNEIQLSVRTFC